ncbi:HAMP domain-containing protein [Mesorhizobium sp. NBSH29]|uniref:sensor histidine kinase n=1 Tax=Mesorhizobium sp. NBSH29 TaxID=2654249 RepID=UPI0018966265|nr:sensor histidine kinase [Mesorhizobium sp. NBSH29]QPC88586.1 HAMP domain-containing protein [Mesorhizobium sp. NBSH29]
MRWPNSLRGRLLAWLMGPLLIIGIVALADTYREAVRTANAVSDRVLTGSALAIAERVVVAENGQLEVDIPYVALEMLTSAAQDRVFYRVDGPDGFITGYKTLPIIEQAGGGGTSYSDGLFRGEPIRLSTLHRTASTGTSSVQFAVTIAETTDARNQLARSILLRSALRLAILIGSAAAIAWLAVTFSLKPLDRLRDAIAQRSPNDLHPIDQSVPREVRSLVDTVNSFMSRLGSALGGMRHFTGNASHQLRTPLTIIRTQLALAARATSLDAARDAARTGDDAVVHAERIITQLLLLAKVDEAASERLLNLDAVNLTELAQTVTGDHISKAHFAGIDLGFEGGPSLHVRGEAMLLSELIRNLIENVIAYAGRGSEATVKVYSAAGSAVFEIEDTGPGISGDQFQTVRHRFVRGQSDNKPGAGLGLPIVDEIASLFGGRMELSTSSAGSGLRIRISFAPYIPER